MDNLQDKLNNIKDKVVGQTKEFVGDITDNEELKLKGRLQYAKSEFKENISEKFTDFKNGFEDISDDFDDKFDAIKENAAGKINDFLDKKDEMKN